jgi:hypothetical protein
VSPEVGSRLPTPRIDHLARLTDETGLLEHAIGLDARRDLGYTTEDAARALAVAVRWQPQTSTVVTLSAIYLSFIRASIVIGAPVRNRMRPDRTWVGPPSADAHGRTIWGLSIAAAESTSEETTETALSCLDRLKPVDDPSIRPWVYTGLGVAGLLTTHAAHQGARRMGEQILDRLPRPAGPAWVWPEPRLTYDNARLPQCLIELGLALDRWDLVADGLRLLSWLIGTERFSDHFSFTPVGGRGPGQTGPAFDQQPLEAAAMADACAAAWKATGEPSWLDLAIEAVEWFVGRNDNGLAVYDPATGAGHDALTLSGVSANAGAESTISALWALQCGRLVESYQAAGPAHRRPGPIPEGHDSRRERAALHPTRGQPDPHRR